MPAPLPLEDEPLEGPNATDLESEAEDATDPMDSGVDPMFASDISEAFPDLDDAQIAALQRAVLGLVAGGGGGTGGPPMGGPPPMPFA